MAGNPGNVFGPAMSVISLEPSCCSSYLLDADDPGSQVSTGFSEEPPVVRKGMRSGSEGVASDIVGVLRTKTVSVAISVELGVLRISSTMTGLESIAAMIPPTSAINAAIMIGSNPFV
jgi:hypothetical protein